jgi:hypothetical protein
MAKQGVSRVALGWPQAGRFVGLLKSRPSADQIDNANAASAVKVEGRWIKVRPMPENRPSKSALRVELERLVCEYKARCAEENASLRRAVPVKKRALR